MRLNFIFLGIAFISVSIFSQRIIYKAKTYIAPRKYIESEVPPEKKNARSHSNICANFAEDRGDSNLNANILFLPLTDFHKINSIYYTNITLQFKLQIDNLKNSEVKTICLKINDESYQVFDPQKSRIEKIGKNLLTVFVMDKNTNISPEFKYTIYLDKGPPEISILKDGNLIDNPINVDCKNGSKVELNSSDNEFHLTHIFYRTKNDLNWKYYHTPFILERNANLYIEAKSTDLVGNESKTITFSCRGDELK